MLTMPHGRRRGCSLLYNVSRHDARACPHQVQGSAVAGATCRAVSGVTAATPAHALHPPKPMSRPERHHPQPDPTTENINAIVEVERQAIRRASFGERVGQAISDVVGTMLFVSVHTAIMMAWIAWNGLAAPSLRFDPYPFGLLTFIVSLEGVLIA